MISREKGKSMTNIRNPTVHFRAAEKWVLADARGPVGMFAVVKISISGATD